jgi:hypothetical protein
LCLILFIVNAIAVRLLLPSAVARNLADPRVCGDLTRAHIKGPLHSRSGPFIQ